MTYRLKLGEEAQAIIDDVLEWSLFRFGASVRDGYHALIRATFRGIAGDPELPGSHSRDDLGQGIRTVHLRTSRNQVSAEAQRIANPRHFVVYRQAGEIIQVVRLLHEAADIRAEYIPK